MEIFRRLVLIFCTIAASSTIMALAPALYILERPDFARELRHHPFAWNHKGQTAIQYMEKEAEGLVRTLPAEIWQSSKRVTRFGFLVTIFNWRAVGTLRRLIVWSGADKHLVCQQAGKTRGGRRCLAII